MSSRKKHFDDPQAFDHNRMYKIKRKNVVGCHDLNCMLRAQSRGLVVAAVVKLPRDKLPEGVYTVLVTCRADVEPPDSSKEQATVSHSEVEWEKVHCSNCDCNQVQTDQSSAKSSKSDGKRQGILFKFNPVVKTVYNPEVWDDERLKNFCLRAYEESESMGRSKPPTKEEGGRGKTYWEGKVTEEGQEYWMGGYVKNSKITNFHFIHPDDLFLKNLS